MKRLLDWRLTRLRRKHALPDLPEVRRLFRLSWLNGFTFGAMGRQVGVARAEALAAIAKVGGNEGGPRDDL
jgi:hypothetical protein